MVDFQEAQVHQFQYQSAFWREDCKSAYEEKKEVQKHLKQFGGSK